MAEQEKEKELLIEITQYVDKSNPEKPPVLLSIAYGFDGEAKSMKYQMAGPISNDLLLQIFKYIKNPLSLICGKYTFMFPIEFRGIVKNGKPQEGHDIVSSDKYSLTIDDPKHNKKALFAKSFSKKVTFSGEFLAPMRFAHIAFEDDVENTALWEGGVEFKDCYFGGKVDFKNSILGTTTIPTLNAFDHCTFHKKADFSNSTFGVKTYFHRSTFKDEALFYRSKFSDVANFYFTTFHKAPNFSMCVFNNSKLANFIGVDTSRFDMENIKEYVVEKGKSEAEGKEGKINSLRGQGHRIFKNPTCTKY